MATPRLWMAHAVAAGLAVAAIFSLTPAQAADASGETIASPASATPAAATPAADSATTPAEIPPGARLAATCSGCHGTNGVTAGDALPALAGQPKASLLASLKAFKKGERPATVMTQLVKGYSDQQLDEVAAFFADQDATGDQE